MATASTVMDAIAKPFSLDNKSNSMTMALGNVVGPVGTSHPRMAKPFALDNTSKTVVLGNMAGLVGTPHPPIAQGGLYQVQTKRVADST
jgi:hypothetical protein